VCDFKTILDGFGAGAAAAAASMMQQANNNGHSPMTTSPSQPPANSLHHAHLVDPRYVDYVHHHHPHHQAHHHPHHLHDPHALHYASLAAAASQQQHQPALPQHPAHLPTSPGKRSADNAGLDGYGGSSDDDGSMDVKPSLAGAERPGEAGGGAAAGGAGRGQGAAKSGSAAGAPDPVTGKKTKGRVKIKMEFIDNKLRRYTTFSKRKTGIMKKVSSMCFLVPPMLGVCKRGKASLCPKIGLSWH